MAQLDGNSNANDVRREYFETASYEEDGSVSKAKRFVTAIRILLAMPARSNRGGRGGSEVEFDRATLAKQLTEARQWIAENDTASDTTPDMTAADFTHFDTRR